MSEQDTRHAEPRRIRFGPGTGQEIPENLASELLEVIWNSNPLKFGEYLKKAMANLWVPSDNGHR
jgi:hypothetical protein